MSISENALFDVGCYVKIIGVKVGLNAKIRVCFETLRHHLFFREAQKSKNNFNNTHQSLPFTKTHRRNITKNSRTKGHYFSYGKILRMNPYCWDIRYIKYHIFKHFRSQGTNRHL